MSWKNGSYSTPRCRGAAPTTPSCSERSATRSTIVWVSKTLSAMCSAGCCSANWQRSCERSTPPGPVDAPISKVPSSSPVASSASSPRISSSSASSRCARPVELQPALGRLHTAPGAVEQLRPEPLLQRPHLERDGRLRHPEPLGRERERLALHHLAERLQLTRVHKRSLCRRDAAAGSGLPELEAVAERVGGVEAGRARDRVVVGDLDPLPRRAGGRGRRGPRRRGRGAPCGRARTGPRRRRAAPARRRGTSSRRGRRAAPASAAPSAPAARRRTRARRPRSPAGAAT